MIKKKSLFFLFLFFFNTVFLFSAESLEQLNKWQLFYHKSPEQVFELADTNAPADFEITSVAYWNRLLKEAGIVPSDGKDYGCYRTVISGLDPSTKYEILQKDSPKTSCAVYVNRQIVAQLGDPFELLKSESAKGSHSFIQPLSFEFYPDSNGNAEIIFFISNYFYRKWGLHDTVFFGPTQSFSNNSYITLYSIICGALLFIGLLCLSQFIINHERKEYFYLGITSIALALRISTNGLSLLSILIPNLPAEIKYKIEYCSMWIVPVCVTQMLDAINPSKKMRPVKYTLIILELVIGLINICVPAYYTNRMVRVLQGAMIVVCAYVIGLSIYNLITKKRYALFNALSYLFVIIGAIIDVLISNGARGFSISLLPFFLVVFVLLQIFMFVKIQNNIYLETVQTSTKLQHLNEAYLRFVPREFLKLLNKESIIKTQLGDYSNIEMCIMFSKVKIHCPVNHGTLEEHFHIFDEYLKRVSPIIKKNKGFVSKFLSGGFMALFPRSELDAIKAALQIKECADEYNNTLATRNHKIEAWMGIHFGKMIIGTIGEENRLDDTVISDTVNTASRLESVCEKLGKTIIVSQALVQKLEEKSSQNTAAGFGLERLEDVHVKGKEMALQIYEVKEI